MTARLDRDTIVGAIGSFSDILGALGFSAVNVGRELKIVCPFHDDHDPSLCINPSKYGGGGLFKCFSCVDSDELVLKRGSGLVPLASVSSGDRVHDVHNGWSVVTKTFPPRRKPVVRIKTSTDANGIRVTPDHLMLVADPVDHKTVTPKPIRVSVVEASRVRRGSWLVYSIPGQAFSRFRVKLHHGRTVPRSRKLIKEVDPYDPAISYMLGLYAAEGYVSGGRAVHFTVHQNEVDRFMPRLLDAAKAFRASASVHPQPGGSKASSIIVSSAAMAALCLQTVGSGCDTKGLDHRILLGPIGAAAQFLMGLFDGDGGSHPTAGDRLRITSRHLVEAARIIALRCNAIVSRQSIARPAGRKPTYAIQFVHRSIQKVRGAAESGRVDRLPVWHTSRRLCEAEYRGRRSWLLLSRVRSVSEDECEVRDITTDSGTFSAGTVSVHNCGWGPEDIFGFVGALHGLDTFPEQMRAVAKLVGISDDGPSLKRVEQEHRPSVESSPKETMTTLQVVQDLMGLKGMAIDPADPARSLGVLPGALEKIAAVVYEDRSRRVLAVPMRDSAGKMTSIRYRDFLTKKRWSHFRKNEQGETVAGTKAGLMAHDGYFDSETREGVITIVVEGETDLLAGVSMMIDQFGDDHERWPARWVALPGVGTCHDLLLASPLSQMVILFFDGDAAGHQAIFDSPPRRAADEEMKGRGHRFVIDIDGKWRPGLLGRLQDAGHRALGCFAPPKADGTGKVDLRDMYISGTRWNDLRAFIMGHSFNVRRDLLGIFVPAPAVIMGGRS